MVSVDDRTRIAADRVRGVASIPIASIGEKEKRWAAALQQPGIRGRIPSSADLSSHFQVEVGGLAPLLAHGVMIHRRIRDSGVFLAAQC